LEFCIFFLKIFFLYYLHEILFQVIWSDEKKWNLDGPDGSKSYWHDLRKEPLYFSKRNFGGGSVMLWGAFSSYGKLQLAFVSNRMNLNDYQKVLDTCLIPFFEEHNNNQLMFMHDNAAIHSSMSTKNWFCTHNIPLFPHPARSPDLNPIENIWGIMPRCVYANNIQYDNKTALKQAIITGWNNLENESLLNLVKSMPNRVYQLIQKKGGPINY